MKWLGQTTDMEDIAGYLMGATVALMLIAWELHLMRRLQEAQLRIAQEQYIARQSPDPVVRPSTAREKSHEGTAG